MKKKAIIFETAASESSTFIKIQYCKPLLFLEININAILKIIINL